MRILYLADGNSSHTRNWVNLLTQSGIDILLFSLTSFDESQYINSRFLNAGFDINDTNTDEHDSYKIKYLKAIRMILKAIKRFNPDLVHAHYATSYGLLGVLSFFHPLIISVWGSDVYYFPKKSCFHKLLLKFNLKNADVILSTSSAMACEASLYTYKNIEVTPFGVDTKRFNPKKVDNIFGKDCIVIGTVKTMDEIYGIDYLIKAFYILRKKYSNIKLLLVGGASKSNVEYLNGLKKLVRELDIESDTVFTGKVSHDRVSEYHNMLSIPVYVSLRESFGVSVIESQSCEKAVIVSDVGGLPEVIKLNETGLMVSAGNENETALAIEKLLINEDLRFAMGKKARQWVIENFSQQIVSQKMIKVYNEVLKNDSPD
jgi:glycosyltransferase involved in cell wall biosynthesis